MIRRRSMIVWLLSMSRYIYIAYLGEFPLEEQGEFDIVIQQSCSGHKSIWAFTILVLLLHRKPAPHMMFVWNDQVCYCKQNFDSN